MIVINLNIISQYFIMTKDKQKNVATNYLGQERDPDNLSKLPPEKIDMITTLASMPEYVHGTGCSCASNKFWKNRCPGGEPIYSKIGKELGISPITVHSYLDWVFREHVNQLSLERSQTEEKKIVKKRYSQSEDGKATNRRAHKRYDKTRKGEKRIERYSETDKYDAKEKRYRQSKKGKATRRRAYRKYRLKNYLTCQRGFEALGFLIEQYPEIYGIPLIGE